MINIIYIIKLNKRILINYIYIIMNSMLGSSMGNETVTPIIYICSSI